MRSSAEPRSLMRKWREKSEGSKAIPKSIFEAL